MHDHPEAKLPTVPNAEKTRTETEKEIKIGVTRALAQSPPPRCRPKKVVLATNEVVNGG